MNIIGEIIFIGDKMKLTDDKMKVIGNKIKLADNNLIPNSGEVKVIASTYLTALVCFHNSNR